MLKKLTAQNFKSLDEISFNFEPINLFIGPNGALRVAGHLRHDQIARKCPEGFGRFVRELKSKRRLLSP